MRRLVMPIISAITLSPDSGGRLEYLQDGEVLPTEKSQLLYMLHRAMINFQQNNPDVKLDLTVIANRNEHKIFSIADWEYVKSECKQCKELRLDNESDGDICEKHLQIQVKIEPATLPGAPVLG